MKSPRTVRPELAEAARKLLERRGVGQSNGVVKRVAHQSLGTHG